MNNNAKTRRDPVDVALSLATGLVSRGGATTSLWAGEGPVEAGYIVAVPGHSLTVPSEHLKPYDITSWLEREREAASQDGIFVGSWLDRETGRAFFDLSLVTESLEDATEAALLAGEVAVFDVANQRDVLVRAVA
jgi:hypothetical protein